MNIMQVKSESAIMACNPLAVLPGLWTNAARLICRYLKFLFDSYQGTYKSFIVLFLRHQYDARKN